MKRVLIIESSEIVRQLLAEQLHSDHRVCTCGDASTAEQLLRQHHPDALLINLRLPGEDGLHFMQRLQPLLPPVIITFAASYSPPMEQSLVDLGVTHCLLTCCPVRVAARHTRHFLKLAGRRTAATAQEMAAVHLRILGVPCQGGFDDLRVGIPIFAQDPQMSMTKEFYPAVATLRGRENWQQVEKAIRAVKEAAYENRNDDVWKLYFSDTSKCPRNKAFIARLAEFIK